MPDLTADRIALRHLAELYAAGCDRRDASLVRQAFAEDGVLTVHWRDRDATSMNGHPEFERIPTGLARYECTMHTISNHIAEIDGDEARCHTYCFAHHITGTNDYVMAIDYEDVCRRIGGEWKIVTRDLWLNWTQNVEVIR